MPAPVTTILFGACDRHNLGDLLFPHIVAAMLPDTPSCVAGLATRDMRPYGGHAVRGIAELARELDSTPVNLVHVGGEILTCAAWDAAVMLLDESGARQALTPYDRATETAREAWARKQLGIRALAPYVVAKQAFGHPRAFVYNAVGGANLDRCDPLLRREVLATLRDADALSVRDRSTRDSLANAGIDAALLPDPGVLVAELFGERIARRRKVGEVADVIRRFTAGYLAVQFSTDFADDASLDAIAAELDALAATTQLGMVFFRAGAAPMHDDLALFRGMQGRMRSTPTAVFESLDIWDICGLIAASQGFLGSSLHGRIVALAHGLPRVTLAAEPGAPGKHRAFAETWEDSAMPRVVALADAASAMRTALDVPRQRSTEHARHLVSVYRQGCPDWLSFLA